MRNFSVLIATALFAAAAFGSSFRLGLADTFTSTPGLAPAFRQWPIPIYTSNVNKTLTWAPNSYEITTKDSRPNVIAWYLTKLKSRAEQIHKGASARVPAQIFVDAGTYIINLETGDRGTSINVVKNAR